MRGDLSVHMDELRWSKREKAIAKRAFELAYERECGSLAGKLKEMAKGIKDPADLWHIRDFLSKQLEEIERKYEFRHSILILLFALLVKQGWLKESDLGGIEDDKMEKIRYLANRRY
jgi:hypothetical protein